MSTTSPKTDLARKFGPLKFSLGTVFIVIMLNFILRIILKKEGSSITILIAGGAVSIMMLWFHITMQRTPIKKECSSFLLFYSGILGIGCLFLVLLSFLNGTVNIAGVFILLLHYLQYLFYFFFCMYLFQKYPKKSDHL